MKYFLSLLVLFSATTFNTAEVKLVSVEDYFWRDYQGLIPRDAIPGGVNQHGQKTYIGQMNIPNYGGALPLSTVNNEIYKLELLPAVITPGNKSAVAVYRAKTVTSNDNSNVKILCSQYAARYTWHNSSNVVGPGCRYVVAGQQYLVALYLGRATYNNQIVFGKVFSDDRLEKKLYFPYEGKQLTLTEYTMLMYCP